MGNEDQREVPLAAKSAAAIALSGPDEWAEAKNLNRDDLYLQAEVYAEAALNGLARAASDDVERAIILGVFSAAFTIGFTVMEQRALQETPNPLVRDLRAIADAGRDATPDQLRQVARLALLREGLDE